MVVKVVIDSSSDLPADIARDLDITVVPLSIHFGDKTYLDGEDLTPDTFYTMLASERTHPRTAQPSVGRFEETYRALAAQGHEIVVLTLPARLSGTYNSAMLAAQSVPEAVVRVIDSGMLSMAHGAMAMEAARLGREGSDVDAIEAAVMAMRPRLDLFIMVDTLTYLQRGGRIGRAGAFAGAMLSVKPLLTLRDGEVVPLQRVRTRGRALQEMAEMVRKNAPLADVYVMHAGAPELGAEFARLVEPVLGRVPPVLPLGPVMGVHVGPGSIGAVTLAKPA